MRMDDRQLDRFKQAVEDKNEAASGKTNAPDEQPELHDPSRPPDTRDPRAKSTGHGKKTADKWNQ
jgi:hypothetical protein